jgi:hypothetical protein
VFRQERAKPLLLRFPFATDNRHWLKGAHRNSPTWNAKGKRWETPKSWFDDVIRRTLERFGSVYVIQAFKVQQKCAPACWDAKGFDCECSCHGANHGSRDPNGWYVVSDTLAVSRGERQYASRLLRANRRAGVGTSEFE